MSEKYNQILKAGLALFLCALFLSSCSQASSSRSNQTIAKNTLVSGQTTSRTYVALGASDTFGTGTDDPYNENWPSDLANLLGGNIHLINLGVPSITAHVALNAELPVALDTHPDLVTVWLAVNDLGTNVPLDSYSHDLDLILSQLQANSPHARIAVGNVPDLTSVPFFYSYNPVTLHQQIDAYNAVIADVVQQHHVLLVDLSDQRYNLQEFPQYISSDGLHPSAAGYERLAELFYQALLKG